MELRDGTPANAGMDPARVARLRERAANLWAPRVSALTLLAARRGVVFLHEAWGKQRPEADGPPLAKDALFPVSSVTKPFTATALMTLVEEGRIDLNRPLQSYLPEFAGEGKGRVFVHQLLTHSSEMDDAAIDYARSAFPVGDTGAPFERYVRMACATPLAYAPASESRYCNAGYLLLLEIVRRETRQEPGALYRERIFEPLGMRNSYMGMPADQLSRVVRWPEHAAGATSPLGRDAPVQYGLNDPGTLATPWGFSGLVSTARDLAVFGQTFLNGGTYDGRRVLAARTAAWMTSNHTPGLKGRVLEYLGDIAIGYGWFVHAMKFPYLPCLASPTAYSHMGFGGAVLFVDPGSDLVLVHLSTQAEVGVWGHPWDFDAFANAVISAVAD